MTKHKRHDDKEFLRRVQNEFPELFEAELSIDLDEAIEALIGADPESLPERKRKARPQKAPFQSKQK